MKSPVRTAVSSRFGSEYVRPVLIWCGAVFLAVAVGAGIAQPGTLLGWMPGMLILSVCAFSAVASPRVVLPVVLSGPYLQEKVTSSLLTPALIVVALIGCANGWASASRQQRRGAMLVGALGAWTLMAGLVFNVRGESTIQVAIAIAYACSVAAFLALGLDPGGRVAMATMAAWGVVVATSIYRNPAISTERTTAVWSENANGAAFIVVVGAVAALSLAEGRRRWLLVLAPLAIYMLFAVISTGSRGALVAAIGSLAFRAVRRTIVAGGTRSTAATLLGVGVVLAAAGPAMAWLIEQSGRDANGSQGNVVSRRDALVAALRTAWRNPLDGVGLGNLSSQGDGLGLQAHNVVAGMSAETGLLAGAIFLVLICVAFVRTRQAPASLPLLVCVLIGGVAVEWWGSSRTGVLGMAAIGIALGGDRPWSRAKGPSDRPVGHRPPPDPREQMNGPRGHKRQSSHRSQQAGALGRIRETVALPATPETSTPVALSPFLRKARVVT